MLLKVLSLFSIALLVSGCSSAPAEPSADEKALIDSGCMILESAFESWELNGESTNTELGEKSAQQLEEATLQVIKAAQEFDPKIEEQKTNFRGPFFLVDLYVVSQDVYEYVESRDSLDYFISPEMGTISKGTDRVNEICGYVPSDSANFDESSLKSIAKSCSVKSSQYSLSADNKTITFTNASSEPLECFLMETVPEYKDSVWITGWGKSGDGETDSYRINWENNGNKDPDLSGPFIVSIQKK